MHQKADMTDRGKLLPIEGVLLVLVLVLSLALRLAALDVFVTSDEDNWQKRSLEFLTALQQHDWAATYQTGHPGVLTMWAGAAAERFPFLQQPLTNDTIRRLMHAPASAPGTGVPPLTLGARRLIALLSWLGIVALFPLLRKLFGPRAALVGTGLVALDPFFLAHSRIHHLDAILTIFTLLSVACLLVYQFRGRQWRYLLASGVAAGLAVANKSPGMFLAPWAGLVLVLPAFLQPQTERRRELLRALRILVLWGVVAAAVLVAVWPAMWVSPVETLKNVFGVALFYAETPHKSSNFFWFSARPDPGPAFYPLAWAVRATPWVLLGLVGLVIARRRLKLAGPLGYVLLWVLLFGAAMTIGEKKFDRYLLPAIPWLDILAGLGWVALLQKWPRASSWRRWAIPSLTAALFVGQLAIVWPTRPYYLSCYDPLIGGSAAAPNLILVGWGEGLEQAAAYLNDKPNASDMVVSSWQLPEFGDFFVGQTVPTVDLDDQQNPKYVPLAAIDYFVFYRNVLQREIVPQVTQLFVGKEQPEHVVSANGIDYAWIYKNTVYQQAEKEILAQINAEGDPAEDVILLDLNATFARTYDGPIPLAIHTLERDDAVATDLQRLSQGRRHIWHLVYPDATGRVSAMLTQHLEEGATVGKEITVDGVRAVRYDLPPEPQFVPAPANPSGVRFGEQLTFLGYDTPQTELQPGSPLHIRLHWQATGPVDRSYVTFVHVIGPSETKYGQLDAIPHGWTLPTTSWQPGELVVDDCSVDISPEAPPGEYVLALGLYDSETHDRLPIYDPAGNRLANDVLLLYGFRVVGNDAG